MITKYEHQTKFSDGKERLDNGELKLTPRKCIWITPETIDEALGLSFILDSLKNKDAIKKFDDGSYLICIYENN